MLAALREDSPGVESTLGVLHGAELVPKLRYDRIPIAITGSSRQDLDWIALAPQSGVESAACSWTSCERPGTCRAQSGYSQAAGSIRPAYVRERGIDRVVALAH
jgi:hypothetical protein